MSSSFSDKKPDITLSDDSVKGVIKMDFVVKDGSGNFYQLSPGSRNSSAFAYFYFYVDNPLTIEGLYTYPEGDDKAGRKEEWDLDLEKGWNRILYYSTTQAANQKRQEHYENIDTTMVFKWTIVQSSGGDIRGTWKKGDITLTIGDDKLTISGSHVLGRDGEYTIDDLSSDSCKFGSYRINFKLENGQLIILTGSGPDELAGTWTKN
jgi:hypothetical protein